MRENGVASDKPLDNLIVTRMRKFGGLNALKRQAMQFIVQTLSPEELAGLRNQFMVCRWWYRREAMYSVHILTRNQSLDKDGNGSITVEELKEGFRKMGTMLEDNEVHHAHASVPLCMSLRPCVCLCALVCACAHISALPHQHIATA